MKKIRVQFLLFVYHHTQKLYRKYFKKKKRQWQFTEEQLLLFEKILWAENWENFINNMVLP